MIRFNFSSFILAITFPILVNAVSLPCTFTFENYPNLCLEIKKSTSFDVPAPKDIAKSGGEIYFYFWDKNTTASKTKNIGNNYDIATELVMPAMLRGGPCYVKKLYEEQWKTDSNGDVYVGKSLIQAGLYRVAIKIRKKGSSDKYSNIKRKIAVPKNDPVLNDPDYDDWVGQFTYQFTVPLKN